MRTPIYKVTNEDDPLDYDYPIGITRAEYARLNCDGDATPEVCALRVGQSVTVGGGAGVQFSILRIR